MTITAGSLGYGGTVNETNTPLWGRSFVGKYGVLGPGDFKVAVKPGVDRTLTVAPGVAFGQQVIDANDATEVTVALDTLATPGASRWDMVRVHRNWAGAGGTTTISKITGTSNQLATFASRAQDPGTVDDQPLALVQVLGGVGGGVINAVIDLRVWVAAGGAFANDQMVLQYMDEVGTSITVGSVRCDRVIDASNNPVWVRTPQALSPVNMLGVGAPLAGVTPPAGTQFAMQAGRQIVGTTGAGDFTVSLPYAFPNGLLSVSAGLAAGLGVAVPGDYRVTWWATGATTPDGRPRLNAFSGRIFAGPQGTVVPSGFFEVWYMAVGW